MGVRNETLNRHAFLLGQLIGANALDEKIVRQRLTEVALSVGLNDSEIHQTMSGALAAGKRAPRCPVNLLDPSDPASSARALLGAEFTADGARTLHRYRGAFYLWIGSCFRVVDDENICAKIWKYLERAQQTTKGGGHSPFKPTRARASDVMEATKAACQLEINPPAWLTWHDAPEAREFFACGNGLLHLPTEKLYPPSPGFFNFTASNVVFDIRAHAPLLWLRFLDQLFGSDRQAIELLQDWFGYCLTLDTSQQKILTLVGPKRSGKGTIARVLSMIVGEDSVAGPTMSSLSNQFGLEPLITKSLAIISDARIGARTDKSAIVERLLAISGEDQLTVDRKHRAAWHGRLCARIVILTNELPSFNDGSGALPSRQMILNLTRSFFDQEDQDLSRKLAAEGPGILNWSIEGYRRLRHNRRFVQPDSSREALEDIEMLAAPVKAFVRDRCSVEVGKSVKGDDLWTAWKFWCAEEGRQDAGTKTWFFRNLRSAEPGIGMSRPRTGVKRGTVYIGIALNDPNWG
jgi:putative DNA primase/helicase